MAANPATEIASAIQSMSIKQHPSPEHDINPSTAADKKIPAKVVSPTLSPTRSDSLSSASITSDVLRPRPRTKSFPPLPDFRFEQSYLASIKNAKSYWQVAFITFKDQVILPLVQGVLWNMMIFGWRFWNRGVKFGGAGLGAKIRKWWWGVNNWKLPAEADYGPNRMAYSQGAEEFYVQKFGSSMGD